MTTSYDLIVIGAGSAGLTAAEEARRQAPDVEIILVSREMTLPYYRLNLTQQIPGIYGDLPVRRLAGFFLHLLRQMFGNRTDMTGRTTRSNDHDVCE